MKYSNNEAKLYVSIIREMKVTIAIRKCWLFHHIYQQVSNNIFWVVEHENFQGSSSKDMPNLKNFFIKKDRVVRTIKEYIASSCLVSLPGVTNDFIYNKIRRIRRMQELLFKQIA